MNARLSILYGIFTRGIFSFFIQNIFSRVCTNISLVSIYSDMVFFNGFGYSMTICEMTEVT